MTSSSPQPHQEVPNYYQTECKQGVRRDTTEGQPEGMKPLTCPFFNLEEFTPVIWSRCSRLGNMLMFSQYG